jgi:DNA helicase II / ATP-dependent DNA helicase PcrA
VPFSSSDVLAGLDDEQRAVAEALSGPVLVLAGAGTGKTRAITHRIAHGVISGEHAAKSSLAVTFTARAAGEMRSRLQTLGVEGVQVRTFHAAALRQLRYFWPRLAGGAFPQIMPSKARLVTETLARAQAGTNFSLVRDVSSDIEWMKVNFLDAVALRQAAPSGTLSREFSLDPLVLADVFEAYESNKADRGLIDFEDVLLLMVAALNRDLGIAAEVMSTYRWFTVDEFQDVNPLQHRLLTLWLGDREEVCVVGDPSQTIYSFTGASPRYLTDFPALYPNATQVRLVRCYRCSPQIVSLANTVITGGSSGRSAVVLKSQNDDAPVPDVQVYSDDVAEARAVARKVGDYIANGGLARDVAVLFRINAQSVELENAFAEAGIPVVLRGTERFFERAEVKEALTRIRGAARGGTHGAGPLGEQVRDVLSSAGWTPISPATTGAVRERWESLSAVVALADELQGDEVSDLAAFIAILDERASVEHAPTADAVTLASLHSAKGLEWAVVFLVGCSEGLLPLLHAESPEQIEEERRLLYVGVTRAARELHISWAYSRQPGGRASRSMSRFLQNLGGGIALLPTDATGQVIKGTPRERSSRSRKGPGKCRICRKGLVTAEERTIGRCRSCPSDINEELFDRLRQWRSAQAKERSVPAFVVFTDATLIAIAEQLPGDLEGLAEIPGIGPAKLDLYGEVLLDLVRAS